MEKEEIAKLWEAYNNMWKDSHPLPEGKGHVYSEEEVNRVRSSIHNEFPVFRELIEESLNDYRISRRHPALEIIPFLEEKDKLALIDSFLPLIFDVGYTKQIEEILLSINKEWLLENIESLMSKFLDESDDMTYWITLELYEAINREKSLKLAREAVKSANSDVREAGIFYGADSEALEG